MKSGYTRLAVSLASAAVAALVLTSCATSAPPADPGGKSAEPVDLTFVAYGGAGQDAMIAAWQEPYTALHPEVTFSNTSPADVAQVKAQVMAGVPQWDLMSVAPFAAAQNCGTLFEPLDLSDLNPADFPEGAIGECYMNVFVNGPIFAYNKEAFPDEATAPKKLADFFDPSIPGKRGIVATLQDGMLEYPLLADGVPADDLYPIDVDRAFKLWEPIRDETIFAENVGALQQAIASKQVDMWLLVSSRQLALLNDGVSLQPVWDRTLASFNSFAVPLGSPKKEAATEFLKFMVQPEQSAREAELGGVGAINLKSKPKLSENGQKVDIYGPENTGETIVQNIAWYAENYNDVQPRLVAWLNG